MRAGDEPFSLYGLIAETIDLAADRGEVTFQLRAEARFSDGKPLTAEDVLFSHALLRDRGTQNQRGYYAKVEKAEAAGPRGVRFVFKREANGEFDRELPLIIGLMPILPKHATRLDVFEDTSLERPIGSGSYVVDRIEQGRVLSYKRLETWWGKDLAVNRGRYNFGEISYEYFKDSASLFEAFKSGEVDLLADDDPVRWTTAYDFPAVREGRVVKREFPSKLSAGMNALQKKEYPTAVENLEKVAAEAPLATVRQNLAFAYDKMGKTDKAKDNRIQAQEIRERKPPVANVAASNTEQPTPAAEMPKTVPKKDTVRSATASSGARMNLIAMENGGKYVSGSNPGLERLINGSEKRVFFQDNDEMVVSFKDEGLATFNEFELFVNENSGHNIQAFELSAGNAPDGNFKLIGKFTPENLVLNQKFSFPPVTARYVKFKMLKSVGGSGYYPAASEIRLMGQLK